MDTTNTKNMIPALRARATGMTPVYLVTAFELRAKAMKLVETWVGGNRRDVAEAIRMADPADLPYSRGPKASAILAIMVANLLSDDDRETLCYLLGTDVPRGLADAAKHGDDRAIGGDA